MERFLVTGSGAWFRSAEQKLELDGGRDGRKNGGLTRGKRCAVMKVFPQLVGGCYDICWISGLWSTQAKVEGIVPRAA